jgi:hypothetical protein
MVGGSDAEFLQVEAHVGPVALLALAEVGASSNEAECDTVMKVGTGILRSDR